MTATETASDGDGPAADDHAYFQAIEATFIGLRGAAVLLSPADWQTARAWHRDGIPLALVQETLRTLFARRREQGKADQIQTLRYCSSAVKRAWKAQQALRAPGRRAEVPAFDIDARLKTLASALPATLDGRERWAARIRALEGIAEEVEETLTTLDAELLADVEKGLDATGRRALEEALTNALATLTKRLPKDEVAAATSRLRQQLLREKQALPVLSLFAPEAEEEGV